MSDLTTSRFGTTSALVAAVKVQDPHRWAAHPEKSPRRGSTSSGWAPVFVTGLLSGKAGPPGARQATGVRAATGKQVRRSGTRFRALP